jgi:hypothetical protein
MATWKKVLVSGSSAALTTVTADTSVTVGSNVVGTNVSNTRLSGSFSGSFYGDGSNLTGVVAAFPSTAVTDLNPTDNFYVKTADGNRSITLNALLTDIAGNNLLADPAGGSATTIKVDPALGATTPLTSVKSTIYNITNGQAAGYIGFVGTASYAATASVAITASYALNAGGGTLTISGSDNTSGTVTLASNPLILTGVANEINTTISNNIVTIGLPDNVTITGDLAVNGGDITTTAASANIFNTNATAITIGGNTTTTTMQNLTLNGDLNVLGTTTTTTTQNLTVADRFVLFGSGSNSNIDGGIVIQNAFAVNNGKATGSGYALFINAEDLTSGHAPRWGVTSSLSELANEATPDEYIVTAKQTALAPATAPTYGGTGNGYGNIHINSATGDIWIYA